MFCKSTIRITAMSVVLAMLTGCTSMQALPSTQPVDVRSNIAVGDRVEILRMSDAQSLRLPRWLLPEPTHRIVEFLTADYTHKYQRGRKTK